MLDRRKFLRSATGAAAAIAVTNQSAHAVSEGSTTAPLSAPGINHSHLDLRLAMAWPDNDQGFGDSARQFAGRIRELTEGRIRFSFSQGTCSGMAAVTAGTADCYYATEHDHLSASRVLAFFAGLPAGSGMPGKDFHNWLTVGGGQALWDDLAGEFGIKPLAIGHSGSASGLWSRIPIRDLRSLSGQSVFVQGLANDVVRALGADVYQGNAAELADAMAAGRLFAAETGGMVASIAAKLPQQARYFYQSGINRNGTVASFGIRREIWDALTSAERAIFEATAATAFHEMLGWADSYDGMMTHACQKTHQIAFHPLAADVSEAIERIGDAVVAYEAGRCRRAERINASYMAFRQASRTIAAASIV